MISFSITIFEAVIILKSINIELSILFPLISINYNNGKAHWITCISLTVTIFCEKKNSTYFEKSLCVIKQYEMSVVMWYRGADV